jgi:hypothetical protein
VTAAQVTRSRVTSSGKSATAGPPPGGLAAGSPCSRLWTNCSDGSTAEGWPAHGHRPGRPGAHGRPSRPIAHTASTRAPTGRTWPPAASASPAAGPIPACPNSRPGEMPLIWARKKKRGEAGVVRPGDLGSDSTLPREVQGGTVRPGSSGRSPVTWATRPHGAPSVPSLPSLCTAAKRPPPRRECARRGPRSHPPPNRKDETMQNTVDQAHGPVPRTLADIIEDAPSADLADLLAGDDHGAARRRRSDPKQDHLMTARAAANTRPTGSPVPGSTPPGAPGPAPAQPAPGRSHTAPTTRLPARGPTRARPRTVPGNTTTRALPRPHPIRTRARPGI